MYQEEILLGECRETWSTKFRQLLVMEKGNIHRNHAECVRLTKAVKTRYICNTCKVPPHKEDYFRRYTTPGEFPFQN
jgi:hypothetical protein